MDIFQRESVVVQMRFLTGIPFLLNSTLWSADRSSGVCARVCQHQRCTIEKTVNVF